MICTPGLLCGLTPSGVQKSGCSMGQRAARGLGTAGTGSGSLGLSHPQPWQSGASLGTVAGEAWDRTAAHFYRSAWKTCLFLTWTSCIFCWPGPQVLNRVWIAAILIGISLCLLISIKSTTLPRMYSDSSSQRWRYWTSAFGIIIDFWDTALLTSLNVDVKWLSSEHNSFSHFSTPPTGYPSSP